MKFGGKIQKIIPMALSLSFLAGCAGHYKRPESIEEKMARFEPQNSQVNQVPLINAGKYRPTRKANRAPASVSEDSKKAKKFSNKRLYFLSLYEQYQTMSQYTDRQNAPKINTCPNFHTSLLTYRENDHRNYSKKELNFDIATFNKNATNEEFLTKNPEYYLPLSTDSIRPRVVDIITKDIPNHEKRAVIQKALNIHVAKTYAELSELCQTGYSDNYYIYENLLTQNKRQSLFSRSSSGINILLRTTVFSNMSLVKSLQKKEEKRNFRGLASSEEKSILTDELFQRLDVNWSKDYFEQE